MNEKEHRRILVLDDEPNIVAAVQRELNSPPFVRYRYEVEGFTDPAAALARAGEQAFDAVISDYRMPGMSGLEFLTALGQLQPDCARLVLSGQTDMETLVRMINETHIYRFIPKPWHDYYLKGSVAQALTYGATLAENRRLADLVRQHNIPVPPVEENNIDQLIIVDDDPGVLSSLSRVLTRRSRVDDLFSAIRSEVANRDGPVLNEGNLSVQVTPSPRHALQMAQSINFSCIVADYRMPEMSGIELLQQFSDLQPTCARILISGQIDENDLIYAVDSAHIFAFIDKPWADFELKACIALALSHRRMLLENSLLAEMVRKSAAAP
ncbi:MAG: response regulator [Rhodocyclaceae bacterium]|jgi:DNA-binding NtrC family response regulator|nr:response regulator [Rhodocyclaceae bacterium]